MFNFSKFFPADCQALLLVVAAVTVCGCQKNIVAFDADFEQEEIPLPVLMIPSDPADTIFAGVYSRNAVLAFYEKVGHRPAWTDREQISVSGDSLFSFIKSIRYRGLLPQKYHFEELSSDRHPSWRPEVLMRRDVLLTDAFLTLAKDLKYGRLRDPGVTYDTALVSLLIRARQERAVLGMLGSQEPDRMQYRFLLRELKKILDLPEESTKRLLLEGNTMDTSSLYKTIQSIEINIERWRWEIGDWSDRYVFVNIPAFMVEVRDRHQLVFESRVIVGKPDHATPEFSSVIQCFVTYPYWHVPRKISVDEFLPVIRRDTSFITRNNFDVLDRRGNILNPDSVKWETFHSNNFPVVLRQREGPENSLGRIKFVFDNPYAVFLHDTNAPGLFRNKVRAFSHGCIRLEKAGALAHYLVTGEAGKKSALIERYLDQKIRHTVDVPRPIPIHIRYFTAEERNGVLAFPEDIYRKDAVLKRRFYTPAQAASRGVSGDSVTDGVGTQK